VLRHQEETSIAPHAAASAAETRVTPQELADALTAIEARRTERDRQIEGTIPIGEAVRQLGLEIAPDEILEEVRAQRTRQAAVEEAQTLRAAQPKARPRPWLWLVALVFAPFFLYSLRSGTRVPPSPAATPVLSSSQQSAILVVDEIGERGVLRTLAEIGDGRPVRCGWTDAVSLLTGGEASSYGYMEGQEQSGPKRWRIIKHGGRIYLRGWLALPMSEAALQTGAVTLYSAPSSKEATPITLPVETSRYQGGTFGVEPEQIRLAISSLDKHAGEKW
jgi:hypothetical protein